MKKYGFLIFSAVIFWGCDKEKTTVYELENYPVGAQVEAYNEIPGMVKVTFTDPSDPNVIMAEGDYKDGKKHGVWIEYDPAQQVPVLIQTYYEGELQGAEFKLDNGTIKEKAYFLQGERHGQTLIYNNTRRVQEAKMYQYGLLNGMVRKFYMKGEVMEEAPYVNGQLDGLAKWYDQEGNLKFQYKYENGQLVDDAPDIGN
jgi:antitoxin component YwqK of YwqJK toxin-antitoxin module